MWVWNTSTGSWHFVTLPPGLSDQIADLTDHRAHGFGSVRVEVSIGSSVWKTSLFPSKEESAYVLPLKKAVRSAQSLSPGAAADVAIRLIED